MGMGGEMKPDKPRRPGAKDTGSNAMKREGRARLSTDVQRKIGQQLRAMYDDVVSQGVPSRFSELLSQLDNPGDKDKRG
jgi:hypothetical protein